jgi:hypothetical protein
VYFEDNFIKDLGEINNLNLINSEWFDLDSDEIIIMLN